MTGGLGTNPHLPCTTGILGIAQLLPTLNPITVSLLDIVLVRMVGKQVLDIRVHLQPSLQVNGHPQDGTGAPILCSKNDLTWTMTHPFHVLAPACLCHKSEWKLMVAMWAIHLEMAGIVNPMDEVACPHCHEWKFNTMIKTSFLPKKFQHHVVCVRKGHFDLRH
jgi:hypothetical protein